MSAPQGRPWHFGDMAQLVEVWRGRRDVISMLVSAARLARS